MLSNQDDGIDELVREMRGRVRGIRKRRHENVKSRLSLLPDFRIERVRKRLRTGVFRRVLPLHVVKIPRERTENERLRAFEKRDVQKRVLARVFLRAAAAFGTRSDRGLDAFNCISNVHHARL